MVHMSGTGIKEPTAIDNYNSVDDDDSNAAVQMNNLH